MSNYFDINKLPDQNQEFKIKLKKKDMITVRISHTDKVKYMADAAEWGISLSEYILSLLEHQHLTKFDKQID